MIGTITPLVQEAAAPGLWRRAVLAYTLGSVTTSMLMGGLLGLVGQLAEGLWSRGWLVLLTLVLTLAGGEFGLIRLPNTPIRRQTCKRWRTRYGPIGSAFLWGGDLGLGITTRISFAGYWGLGATCLFLADPLHGALLMSGYGVGRAVLVLTGRLFVQGRALTILSQIIGALLRESRPWHRLHGWALCLLAALVTLQISGFLR